MTDKILQLFEGDFKGGSEGDFYLFRGTERLSCKESPSYRINDLNIAEKQSFQISRAFFKNAPLVFRCHISISVAIFSLTASAAAMTGFIDKCVYLCVIELILCPNNPAMMLSEYPISAAIVAKLCRNA